MKSRNSRTNNGYIGNNTILNPNNTGGVINQTRNYLSAIDGAWNRPSQWLPMPSMTSGDNMVAGLVAVYPGNPALIGPTASGNFIAFKAFGCTYTVNWGNGITQDFASGATAQYNFDYSSLPDSTTVPTNDGLSGYRQTLITVFPSAAGLSFGGFNFNVPFAVTGMNSPGWPRGRNFLDIKIAGRNITGNNDTTTSTGFTLRPSTIISSPSGTQTATCTFPVLQQFEWVGSSQIRVAAGMFRGITSLKSVRGTEWTSNMTSFADMFNGCRNLESIPLFDTSKVTTFASAFNDCSSLQYVPLFNTSATTTCSSMFNGCSSLRYVPAFDFSNSTSMVQCFLGCSSLKTVEFTKTGLVTNFSQMFENCFSLETVPLFNTTSATNMSSMFNNCYSLRAVPPFNAETVTNFSSMCNNCYSLTDFGLTNTSSGTNFSSMFNSAISLQSVPLMNTATGNNFSSMFSGCSSLIAVPLLNVRANRSTISNIFQNCPQLAQGALTGTDRVMSNPGYTACNLSSAALDMIFTSLATTGGANATIWIGGNWGTSGCNRSIATSKGWIVVG